MTTPKRCFVQALYEVLHGPGTTLATAWVLLMLTAGLARLWG